MLSMENDKQVTSTSWKKVGAVVGCTASVAAVAFVASTGSGNANANSTLMNIPTDFSGEFQVLHDQGDYRGDGIFHKYETEEGDWKIDGKLVAKTRIEEGVDVFSMYDNIPVMEHIKNGAISDVECFEAQAFPQYGFLKESMENAVSMDETKVDPYLLTKMSLCPEDSSKHMIHWEDQNYGLCGQVDQNDNFMMHAFGEHYNFIIRSNDRVLDYNFEHREVIKQMNCTQLNARKSILESFVEKMGMEDERKPRQLSVQAQEWPYTQHRHTGRDLSLTGFGATSLTSEEYEDGAYEEEEKSEGHSSMSEADVWWNDEDQTNGSGGAGGNASTGAVREMGNFVLDFQFVGDDAARLGFNKGLSVGDNFRNRAGLSDYHIEKSINEQLIPMDEGVNDLQDRIDLSFQKGWADLGGGNAMDRIQPFVPVRIPQPTLRRPAPYNPPGFDAMRCFFFHGIGGVGNMPASAPTHPVGPDRHGEQMNKYIGSNTAGPAYWWVAGTKGYNHHGGPRQSMEKPYTSDSNGQTVVQLSYYYFGGGPGIGSVYNWGTNYSCDEYTVMDANSIDQGYDNADIQGYFCDLYLDGDNMLTYTDQRGQTHTTANPLHWYGYAHPHDHKVIFTHSMGGMYSYKALALGQCEKTLPTSVINTITGAGPSFTGTLMETNMYQSQPPMDGSNSAAIPRFLCPALYKLIQIGVTALWAFLKCWNIALYRVLKAIHWIWSKITGQTLRTYIEDRVMEIHLISNGCDSNWEQRAAHASIERGVPTYSGTGHRNQEFFHADERMCGVSPWGTGGGSGWKFIGLSMVAMLEWIYRPICLYWLKVPCKCSWRGCAWCAVACMFVFPWVPYNDGAVSYTSCTTWGEGVGEPTILLLNHDDGTGRNLSGTYAQRNVFKWYRAMADMARSETLMDNGYLPTSYGGLVVSSHWYHAKFNRAIPQGDRDGSSTWIKEVLTGGLSSGSVIATNAACGQIGHGPTDGSEPGDTQEEAAVKSLCRTNVSKAMEQRVFRILPFSEALGVDQHYMMDSTVTRATTGQNQMGTSSPYMVDVLSVDNWNLADSVEFYSVGNNVAAFTVRTVPQGYIESPVNDMTISATGVTGTPPTASTAQLRFMNTVQIAYVNDIGKIAGTYPVEKLSQSMISIPPYTDTTEANLQLVTWTSNHGKSVAEQLRDGVEYENVRKGMRPGDDGNLQAEKDGGQDPNKHKMDFHARQAPNLLSVSAPMRRG